jgi:hypothetical protein
VSVEIVVFWSVTACTIVSEYQYFEGMLSLAASYRISLLPYPVHFGSKCGSIVLL